MHEGWFGKLTPQKKEIHKMKKKLGGQLPAYTQILEDNSQWTSSYGCW
jgi:hypothetical protein